MECYLERCSSFPVMRKFGNLGICVLLTTKINMYIIINDIRLKKYNSKFEFALKFIPLIFISNLCSLKAVLKCQHCICKNLNLQWGGAIISQFHGVFGQNWQNTWSVSSILRVRPFHAEILAPCLN